MDFFSKERDRQERNKQESLSREWDNALKREKSNSVSGRGNLNGMRKHK